MKASSSDPLKVLIVRPQLGQGGADQVTLTLIRHLSSSRFRTTLAVARAGGALESRLPQTTELVNLNARSLWTAWIGLARLINERRPDVLFSTSSGFNMAAALAHTVVRSSARLVLSERSTLLRPGGGTKRQIQLILKRTLYRRADAITAVSEGVRSDLLKRLGLLEERVHTVSNPVIDRGLAGLALEGVTHPWLVPEALRETPVCLAAGRLVPVKDFSTLLKGFRLVRDKYRARLIVLGEGPQRARLEDLVGELDLTADVSLPGFVANPLAYMSRATVFVLSSRAEGLPGVLIQAMACGTAVVSTDCDAGPSEIITSDRTGLLVPVGSAEALAQAILRLLKNDSLRKALAAQAQVDSGRFSVENVLPRYERILTG